MTIQMSYEEWIKEGKRRFGDDIMKWRFVCPICGATFAIEDFRPYKELGATSDSATCECIGRYMPKEKRVEAFGEKGNKITKPCDYAGYGLFKLSPVVIIKDGIEQDCFDFAEPEEATPVLENTTPSESVS